MTRVKHTQSAGGVVLRDDSVVVVNQKGTSWSLPKGHIGRDGSLKGAEREIGEEAGITSLRWVRKLGTYQRYKIGDDGREEKTELKTIHMYLFHTKQVALHPNDPDIREARWVSKDNVAGLLTHPKDREFFLSVIHEIGSSPAPGSRN